MLRSAPMRRTLLFATIQTLLVGACGATPANPSTTTPSPAAVTQPTEPIADPEFLREWALTHGYRNGHPTTFRFIPDGSELLFLRSGPRDTKRALYAVNVGSGQERELLTAERLLGGSEEELSAEERALRERLRMTARGITTFEVSRDGRQLLIPLSGRLFIFERATEEITELVSEGGYANSARLSPDGRFVGCVRSGDLYVIDIEANRQQRLTRDASATLTNGLAEFVAQEEMSRYRGFWWSPDSSKLLYQQSNSEAVELLYASNPIDPADAPSAARYPRAGTPNAVVRLGVIPATGGRTTWLNWDQSAFPYVTTVRWPRTGPLTVVVQNRTQQHTRLLTANPSSGATTTIHDEQDAAWLNIDQSVPRWLDAERYLWSSERSGHWQLELRRIGSDEVTILAPNSGYVELLHVEGTDAVWIQASPDPTRTHLVRIPLSDAEPQSASQADGQHEGSFGPDGLWVQRSHTLSDGPMFALRRGTDQRIADIESKAATPNFVPVVEHLRVGERNYNAMVIRPRNFDPSRQYPVLLSVYGGPGHIRVRRGRDLQLREQWQADHGFVVVSLDGRGTPGRGREWERAIRGNFVDIPLEDQATGLRALGERFPELDLTRVGVYGWSFGGYMSAMAVLRQPDVFKVGVAGAPVCDWQDYDTHYTERFMGLPSENESGYQASSVLAYTGNLVRPLMIIHGTSDDNVYFTHALKMSDALMRSGGPHELVVLAGSTHMVADPSVAEALQARIMKFLMDGLNAAAPGH